MCSQKCWKMNEISSASCNTASVLFCCKHFYFEIIVDSYGLEKIIQIYPLFTQLPPVVTSKLWYSYHNQDIHIDTITDLRFPQLCVCVCMCMCVCVYFYEILFTCVGSCIYQHCQSICQIVLSPQAPLMLAIYNPSHIIPCLPVTFWDCFFLTQQNSL